MHILLIIFILGVVALLAKIIHARRSRPEARLRRDFAKLQKLILSNLERKDRPQAKSMLLACGEHIESLLSAREQHQLLLSMADATERLTGQSTAQAGAREAIERYNHEVSESLAQFFSDLGRIATLIGLKQSEPLSELNAFTDDLELRRQVLIQLSAELSQTSSEPLSTPHETVVSPQHHKEFS